MCLNSFQIHSQTFSWILPAIGFSILFSSLPTGAGRIGDAMSESAVTLIAMGKARVTPTVSASATSAAEAAHEGGAAAAAGAAAGGRAETGEVRSAAAVQRLVRDRVA